MNAWVLAIFVHVYITQLVDCNVNNSIIYFITSIILYDYVGMYGYTLCLYSYAYID